MNRLFMDTIEKVFSSSITWNGIHNQLGMYLALARNSGKDNTARYLASLYYTQDDNMIAKLVAAFNANPDIEDWLRGASTDTDSFNTGVLDDDEALSYIVDILQISPMEAITALGSTDMLKVAAKQEGLRKEIKNLQARRRRLEKNKKLSVLEKVRKLSEVKKMTHIYRQELKRTSTIKKQTERLINGKKLIKPNKKTRNKNAKKKNR